MRMERVVRAHWAIKNNLHWVLDIAFDEDSNRICKEQSAAHLAVIRHIALNLIKAEKNIYGRHQDQGDQEEVPKGVIHLTQGYSRDHRLDLNQVVLQLISEHQTGIPLWIDALSGNSSDKESFRQTLNAHLE